MPTRILVVDDTKVARDVTVMLLRGEGYEVDVASNGVEALQKIVAQKPDLVLSDVMMPQMDGFELTRRLRANEATRHLPILILTARGDIADKIQGFQAGADDYLIKAADPAEVILRVKVLLMRAAPVPRAPEAKTTGQVLLICGPKGGVGATTAAVNFTLALKQRTPKKVLLVDNDFFTGDLALYLNLSGSYNILDMVRSSDSLNAEFLHDVVMHHPSGVDALLGSPTPEDAELLHAEPLKELLSLVKQTYDYTVVDHTASYDERMLALLESSDTIWLVICPEVAVIKNAVQWLALVEKLGFSIERIQVILNKAHRQMDINLADIRRSLPIRIAQIIPHGGFPIISAANRGEPYFLSDKDKDSPWRTTFNDMAEHFVSADSAIAKLKTG